MGLLELFITACMPVLNMLLVTGVGSFLATDSAGILGKEARKHLNYVVFYVFNPALIATYLAKTITMESLAKLWFMPVNVFFTFIFGLILGWIVIKVTGAPLKLRGLILGCCSAGNLGNIFLIIIPALCKEKGSPFGTPDVCQTYGLAYSSLSLAIIGFIIGGIPLIRNALIGDDAPLRVLRESGELIGGAAVPSVTLIMGGNLITGMRGRASVPPSVIAGVAVVRFVLLPLVGTALVNAAVRYGVIRPDPLYQFVLLLQYAVPPAMNIGTITQLFGVGESECSVIFVWVYALASVAVTMWSAFFMWTLS
uniref:Transporter C5D6.04 n=1 Tax=Triticum urartu TaxID=4572 RepID=A0A8R7QDP2_TRIUA